MCTSTSTITTRAVDETADVNCESLIVVWTTTAVTELNTTRQILYYWTTNLRW